MISTDFTFKGLRGRLIMFDDGHHLIRSTVRLSCVMLFKRSFQICEIVSENAKVHGATIFKSHISEFLNLFPENEILAEERATIQEMADLDFVFCLNAASTSQALLEHELAHVLYHTDPDHRAAVDGLWDDLEELSRVVCKTYLLDCGYKEEEFQDEFFAALFDGYPELISLMPEVQFLYDQTKHRIEKLAKELSNGVNQERDLLSLR